MSPCIAPPFWNIFENFFTKKFLDLPLEYTLNSAKQSENFDFLASLSNWACRAIFFCKKIILHTSLFGSAEYLPGLWVSVSGHKSFFGLLFLGYGLWILWTKNKAWNTWYSLSVEQRSGHNIFTFHKRALLRNSWTSETYFFFILKISLYYSFFMSFRSAFDFVTKMLQTSLFSTLFLCPLIIISHDFKSVFGVIYKPRCLIFGYFGPLPHRGRFW